MSISMKQLYVGMLLCIGLTCVFSLASATEDPNAPQSTPAADDPNASAAKTMKEWDRYSYVIGMHMAKNLQEQNFNINVELVIQGVRDLLMGNKPMFNEEEVEEIWKGFMQWQRDRRKEKQEAEKVKQEEQKKKELEQAIKDLGENAWKLQLEKPALMTFDPEKEYFWIMETNKGTIKIRLMPEVVPMHVTSTIFLTNKKFYDGLTFHRVIPGFMAQGGCPVGNGKHGPGYQYDGEIDPNVVHDKPYLLSTANTGPGTDGSQFFITFKATPWLNGKHTIFGEVVEGQDVVKKLEEAGTSTGTPKETLTINTARIEEKEQQP